MSRTIRRRVPTVIEVEIDLPTQLYWQADSVHSVSLKKRAAESA
jgi:type IV secretory pathway VirB3-like protein